MPVPQGQRYPVKLSPPYFPLAVSVFLAGKVLMRTAAIISGQGNKPAHIHSGRIAGSWFVLPGPERISVHFFELQTDLPDSDNTPFNVKDT